MSNANRDHKKQGESTRHTRHVVSQGQETGCHLSTKNGKGGSADCYGLPMRNGSNCPGLQLSGNAAQPSCTSLVVPDGAATQLGRPSRENGRNRPPVNSRARRSKKLFCEPNNSQTTHESLSVTGRALGMSTSTDSSKQGVHPTEQVRPGGGRKWGTREIRRTWCNPGRGTPRNLRGPNLPPAVSQTRHPTGAGTGSDLAVTASAVAVTEARLDRVSTSKHASISSGPGNGSVALRAKIASSTDNRLERVVEEVTVLSPTKQAGRTVDAPNGQLLTSIDGPKSPRVKNKLRTSRIFSACRQHKDSIYSLDHSDNNGTNEVQPAVFPPSPMTVHLMERADYLSEYTRVVGGDVTLRQRDHTTWIQLFS